MIEKEEKEDLWQTKGGMKRLGKGRREEKLLKRKVRDERRNKRRGK